MLTENEIIALQNHTGSAMRLLLSSKDNQKQTENDIAWINVCYERLEWVYLQCVAKMFRAPFVGDGEDDD